MAQVGFVSLGCPKNLVDSEVMLGMLKSAGHELTSHQEEAEILIVNTCGFIQSAQQESIDTILELAREKTTGRCQRLIVAGCLVERYRQEIQEAIPEVDAVIGTNEIPKILELCRDLNETVTQQAPIFEDRELFLYDHNNPRELTTPGHTAYIKIAEGCDHPCTFCVIPQMRGRFRSRSFDSVIEEAERLTRLGVRELNLVGQDTTMYGWDMGNKNGLADLLARLNEIPEVEWVRFLYAYPNNISVNLLDTIHQCPKVCSYIDLPLQHASRLVLKGMKRGGNCGSLTRLVARIRERIPNVVLRTTMIVGFPGETDDDFDQLMEFAEKVRFDRLGAFVFSDEEHAGSHVLPGKIPDEVKLERRDRLMNLQSKISHALNARMLGKQIPVMLEGVSKESDFLWQGRTQGQAPDIDGVVYLVDGVCRDMKPGEIRNARIDKVHPYDLVGTVMP
jgi:ribosomal protein S12 methylthiotransferase